MENKPQKEPYYQELIKLGYAPLNYSDKHYIFRKGDIIIKIARNEFNGPSNDESFIIEKTAHDLLLKYNMPVAKIRRIYTKKELIEDFSALEEEYVYGDIFYDKNSDVGLLLEVFRFADCTANIVSKKFGWVNCDGAGDFDSWKEFIRHIIDSSKSDRESLENGFRFVPDKCDGSFILTDMNMANFVFTDGKLKCALDIERPLFGDKLFLYAVIKMRNPKMFSLLPISFDQYQLSLIDYYSLVYKHLFDAIKFHSK